jgi:hypothetical protein
MDLRDLIDPFHKDWFGNWKPHITTDLEQIDLPFTRYCICQGDKILREYSGETVPHLIKAIHKVLSAIEGDKIPGGIGDDVPFSDVDQDELKAGTFVELEHTQDFDIAKEIAKDHLTEDKFYYTKLKKFEDSLK